ncbi:DUF835 domain-containing protein [Thermococcus sp. M36]|nr:DUF835 domain-containing protein [Thermococcus sp. M36]
MLKLRRSPSESRVIDYRRLGELLQANGDRKKLLITRKPPCEIRAENIQQIWLTKISHPQGVPPSRLHAIEQRVWEQLREGEADVILDAVEYLILENGVESTLRFVSKIRDMAVINGCEFYVTVGEGLEPIVVNILKKIVD